MATFRNAAGHTVTVEDGSKVEARLTRLGHLWTRVDPPTSDPVDEGQGDESDPVDVGEVEGEHGHADDTSVLD